MSNIEKYTSFFQNDNKEFFHLDWIEPIFIGMVRAYQADNDFAIRTDNSYLQSMILQNHTPDKTYSPIEKIENGRIGLERVSTHITDVMLKNFAELAPGDIRDLRNYLQYLFLELMNNVVDHAYSPVGGYTMAQYYPNGKKIQFVVADRGVAFLQNMRLNYDHVTTEAEAIQQALEKGVTSTRQTIYNQPKNAGYGLYAMFEILKMTGGKFVIISNDTLLRYENKRFTVKQMAHPWKGVVVAFEFFEANINYDMDYFKREYLWNLEEEDSFF
jgi:anti-sigma regulatory factor (Ser/Thr protein kinase)